MSYIQEAREARQVAQDYCEEKGHADSLFGWCRRCGHMDDRAKYFPPIPPLYVHPNFIRQLQRMEREEALKALIPPTLTGHTRDKYTSHVELGDDFELYDAGLAAGLQRI